MPLPHLRSLILDVLASHRSVRESGYLRLFPEQNAVSAPTSTPKLLPTVLLKVQGPLSTHHLGNIGAGVAYLRRLGVSSVIVLDHPAWDVSGVSSDTCTATLDEEDMGKRHQSVRHQMAGEVSRMAHALEQNGIEARPFLHALMRPPSIPNVRSDGLTVDNGGRAGSKVALVPDCKLRSVRAALDSNKTPILPPLALYPSVGGMTTRAVPARQFLPELARELASEGACEGSTVDLTPVRVMLINRFGRIPSNGGKIHLSCEYESVARALLDSGHQAAAEELEVARECLSVLPRDSAAITLSPRSPRNLIVNLLTDKACAAEDQPEVTVVRHGLPVRILRRFADVDWDRMQYLLEASFGRRMDRDAYLTRLRRNLDFVVVLGDYEGGAIVTREWAPGESRTIPPIIYLDKFALLPALRGSGAVEMLWSAIRREVYALPTGSILRSFSTERSRDLVWKSRRTNPVNNWYHDRSNGYLKLPCAPFGPTSPATERWNMFWCDAEDRLAHLAETQPQSQDIVSSRLPGAAGLDDQDDPLIFSLNRPRMWAAPRPWPWGRETRPMHTLAAGDALPKTVPLIAPGEEGRLARWSAALFSIPSCWLP